MKMPTAEEVEEIAGHLADKFLEPNYALTIQKVTEMPVLRAMLAADEEKVTA